MSSQDNRNSSSSSRQRRDRRPRRNRDNDDPHAAFKEQIKAERRAQVRQNVNDNEESNETMVGDNMDAGNVSSVPRSSQRGSNNGRERGSGSSSRSGRARGQNRPPKTSNKGAPAQVGAVATTGRAFGAPRRPPTARNNMTRSIAGDGHYDSSDDEEAPRHPKEVVAMNAMTVEDHEREKRRQRKVQEEASRLTQEIKNEARNKKAKKKPYGKDMAFVVAQEDDDDDDHVGKEELPADDASDSAGRWKKIAMCLGCALVLVVVSVILLLTLRHRALLQSLQDCVRIRSGLAVEGQEDLEARPYRMAFDIKLTDPNLPTTTWAPAFKEGIDGVLIPAFAGCPIGRRRMERVGDQSRALRKATSETKLTPVALDQGFPRMLQEVDSVIRYVIANAKATIKPSAHVTDNCEIQRDGCKNVMVIMELFLKGEEKSFDIITLIAQVMQALMDLEMGNGIRQLSVIDEEEHPQQHHRKLLARILGLDSNIFESVTYRGTESMDPTVSPTTPPTNVPNIDTQFPTNRPSSSTTGLPTLSPTISSSSAPTSLPL